MQKLIPSTFKLQPIEKSALSESAKEQGLTMTDVVRLLIRQDAKSRNIWARVISEKVGMNEHSN